MFSSKLADRTIILATYVASIIGKNNLFIGICIIDIKESVNNILPSIPNTEVARTFIIPFLKYLIA